MNYRINQKNVILLSTFFIFCESMEKGVEFADITSKMAFFVTLVNVWKLLTNATNATKSSILNASGVLDMPVFLCKCIMLIMNISN